MVKRKITSAEEARKVILSLNERGAIARKVLINKCVANLGYTKEDTANEVSGGDLNLAKCHLGYALNQLIRAGSIRELDGGQLQFTDEEFDKVNLKIEVENIILSLTADDAYTKEELLDKTCEIFFEKHSRLTAHNDNKNAVKGYAGNFINTPFIPKSNGLYGRKKESLREENKRYLNVLSSEEFEAYSVKLLETYYNKFVYIGGCKGVHCGGSDDGGIDGIIEVKDNMLGSSDAIFMQVKQKKSENKNAKQNTMHELREFGGTLATRPEALKGIFVTNISYIPKNFLNAYKLKPLIFINGELWLDIAEQCGFRIADYEN